MKRLFGFLLMALLTAAASSARADSSTTYYAKLTVDISSNSPTGAGTVYASTDSNATIGSASAIGSASSKEDSASDAGYREVPWHGPSYFHGQVPQARHGDPAPLT